MLTFAKLLFWYLFWQKGNEVSLELWLDDGHHVSDLGGLASRDQLIDGQDLLGVRPSAENAEPIQHFLGRIILIWDLKENSKMQICFVSRTGVVAFASKEHFTASFNEVALTSFLSGCD